MESCQVRLHGNSEFEASNVLIEGDQRFEVPDGHRMLVTTGPAGGLPHCCCASTGAAYGGCCSPPVCDMTASMLLYLSKLPT